jgi:phosphonopyruvate decarboxylase
MIQAEAFISACASRGYTLFTGVPCSLLNPIINHVIQRSDLDYIAASSEGEAVAIAAGAYLAGRKTVVMCQNSGLGNAVNPLSSLNFPFRIPTLLIVTLRGEPGIKDAPQHELMGQITKNILDTLRIPSTLLPTSDELIEVALDTSEETIDSSSLPYAFIMKKGSVVGDDNACEGKAAASAASTGPTGRFACPPGDRMLRLDAIRAIQEIIPDTAAVIATTGKTGRELFTLADNSNHLYMVGSMGCASGAGFGVQYVKPDQRVVVLDGDGATLMKMGTMGTIGHYSPPKLLHIILDNEAYESTGGQFSVSSTVDFCGVASACGYRQSARADTRDVLIESVRMVKDLPGPSLIHMKVACGSAPDLARPTLKPFEVKERFMRFLRTEAGKQ